MSGAPRLARHARLRHDAARGQWVLLAPERVLVLDETAQAILSRLDGERDVPVIAALLAAEYDAPAEEIARDVREVLEDLRVQGLIEGMEPP